MRRRQVLAAVPLLAGFAGCSGDSNRPSDGTADRTVMGTTDGPMTEATGRTETGTTDRTPTSSASGTVTGTPGRTPADTLVRANYRYRFYADSFRVASPERDQFAFVRPPDVAGEPAPESVSITVGDRVYQPIPNIATPPLMPNIDHIYTAAEPRGWLAFDLPTLDAERGSLVVDGTRYPLPDDALSSLSAVPSFAVESVAVPDSVPTGGTIELTVTVTNEGARDGLFLAGFQHSGLPELLSVEVPAGKTAQTTGTYEAYPEGGSMPFTFHHAGGSESYEVEIGGTATG